MGLMSVFLWMVSMKQHSKKREVFSRDKIIWYTMLFFCYSIFFIPFSISVIISFIVWIFRGKKKYGDITFKEWFSLEYGCDYDGYY